MTSGIVAGLFLGSLYSGQHFFEFLQDDHLVCIFRKIFDPEITQFYSSYTLTFFLLAAEVCLWSISTRIPNSSLFARCWHFVFSSPLFHLVFAGAFSHFFPLLPSSQKSLMLWKYRSCKVDHLYLLTSIYAPNLDLSLFYSQTHFSACLGSMKSRIWSSLAKPVSQMWEQTRISMQESSSMSLLFWSLLGLNLPW